MMVFALAPLHGQGNLQFNRVVLIEVDFVLPNSSLNQFVEQTFVVPPGKVLKVETAHGTYESLLSTPSFHSWPQVLINNKLVHHYVTSSGTAQYNYLPMWLPEGTYTLRVVSYNGSTAGASVHGGISGIEFNVVP